MDLLGYALFSVAAGLALVAALPGGLALLAAGLALLRDSRLVQWLALAVAVLLAIAAVRRDGEKRGKAAALRDVEAANRRAIERRRAVDDDVARRDDSQVREGLKRWSK